MSVRPRLLIFDLPRERRVMRWTMYRWHGGTMCGGWWPGPRPCCQPAVHVETVRGACCRSRSLQLDRVLFTPIHPPNPPSNIPRSLLLLFSNIHLGVLGFLERSLIVSRKRRFGTRETTATAHTLRCPVHTHTLFESALRFIRHRITTTNHDHPPSTATPLVFPHSHSHFSLQD